MPGPLPGKTPAFSVACARQALLACAHHCRNQSSRSAERAILSTQAPAGQRSTQCNGGTQHDHQARCDVMVDPQGERAWLRRAVGRRPPHRRSAWPALACWLLPAWSTNPYLPAASRSVLAALLAAHLVLHCAAGMWACAVPACQPAALQGSPGFPAPACRCRRPSLKCLHLGSHLSG